MRPATSGGSPRNGNHGLGERGNATNPKEIYLGEAGFPQQETQRAEGPEFDVAAIPQAGEVVIEPAKGSQSEILAISVIGGRDDCGSSRFDKVEKIYRKEARIVQVLDNFQTYDERKATVDSAKVVIGRASFDLKMRKCFVGYSHAGFGGVYADDRSKSAHPIGSAAITATQFKNAARFECRYNFFDRR